MDKGNDVQWHKGAHGASLEFLMSGQLVDSTLNPETKRLALDMPREDVDFLDRFASYSNEVDVLENRQRRRKWRRKSIAERLLSAQVTTIRAQLQAIITQLGPLPAAPDDEDDEKTQREKTAAMAKYAKAALAFAAQSTKKK